MGGRLRRLFLRYEREFQIGVLGFGFPIGVIIICRGIQNKHKDKSPEERRAAIIKEKEDFEESLNNLQNKCYSFMEERVNRVNPDVKEWVHRKYKRLIGEDDDE